MHSNRLKQLQERFYLVAAIFSSFFLLLFSIHIFLVRSRTRAPRGLEPYLLGLDLPDSVRELVLTWVVVALAHVVLVRMEVKARARLLKCECTRFGFLKRMSRIIQYRVFCIKFLLDFPASGVVWDTHCFGAGARWLVGG
jgi:hypothetical protein